MTIMPKQFNRLVTKKEFCELKNDSAELVIKKLKSFQAKKKELEKDPSYVKKVLDDGAKKASKIAKKKSS